jgi:hypothetical protein
MASLIPSRFRMEANMLGIPLDPLNSDSQECGSRDSCLVFEL